MRIRLIRRLLLRFRQVDNRRRALLVEAVMCLLAARLALIFVPFPRLARHIGTFVPPTALSLPFKAVCLPQAMAARVMLKRRGVASVMHFGAARGRDKLDAHAW